MKKILTTLVLAFSAMTMMAEEFKIGKLTFEIISSTEVSLKSADQDITKAFLGETIDYQGKTYTLTSICSEAFEGCTSLTSVTIPNSVTEIGEGAFYWCSKIRTIYIPKGTKERFATMGNCSTGRTNWWNSRRLSGYSRSGAAVPKVLILG